MSKDVYILAVSQISVQEPLTLDWLDDPLRPSGRYAPCREPDFRPFFTPMQARRMGPLFKRAAAVSRKVVEEAGTGCPEGIFTGAGLGCIANTWDFLESMCTAGEEALSPTLFMQSTHNTVGSMIAMDAGCHGYNCTYSQDGISFESAMLDAFLQIRGDMIGNALAGVHEELPERLAAFVEKGAGGPCEYPLSEGSAALMLSGSVPEGKKAMCRLSGVRILHRPSNLDEVVSAYGASSVLGNDFFYSLFGRSFSSSGLGACAAAGMVASGRVPSVLLVNVSGPDAGLVFLEKA